MPLALLLLLASTSFANETIKTADGWTLDAVYRAPKAGRPVLVLAHGVGAGKGEWVKLADALAAKGVGTLALDLRAHGGSVRGPDGPRDWTTLDARQEWLRMPEDLLAAAKWLQARGVPAGKIAFGGASIGANLASQAAAKRAATPFLVLFSASNNYRGVMLAARPGLPTLAVAARADGYAYEGSKGLAAKAGVKFVEAPGAHGAPMLDDAATLGKVVAWIASR